MLYNDNPLVQRMLNLTDNEIKNYIKEIKIAERINAEENFKKFINSKMKGKGKNNYGLRK